MILGLVFCLVIGSNAYATLIHMSGTVAGGPVDVYADFISGTDTLTVKVWNATINPGNVGQNISDLFFVLSTGQTTGTLTSSLGLERSVASNKTYTDGASGSTGWGLNSSYVLGSQTGLRLYVLGTPVAPENTIIGLPDSGTDTYSNANASIKGNAPHNPFLFGDSITPVTFIIDISGVTAGTTVTYAAFSFGTTEGDWLKPPEVPEPTSLLLFGVGLLGLAGIAVRIKK